ncbi:hypothetical protein XELAEV_18023754mg [Xenopus laevis]|uniref:Uncharacterized protein n=1 Tax=Xenopus laevis TaxID=8355 RepID=A0A974D6M0_XENLA|nr:hypothetical protein XELAEV_18023754mg [Xenopus laevis]
MSLNPVLSKKKLADKTVGKASQALYVTQTGSFPHPTPLLTVMPKHPMAWHLTAKWILWGRARICLHMKRVFLEVSNFYCEGNRLPLETEIECKRLQYIYIIKGNTFL